MTHRRSKRSGAPATACSMENSTSPAPIANGRSIFARLMWWAIGLSAALVLALWLLTHNTVETMSGASVERAVDVDLAGLVDIYASGGQDELVRRIADRQSLTEREGTAPHYLLSDNAGTALAGDLKKWPSLDASSSEAGRLQLDSGVEAHARATQLGPDLQLLVAREMGDIAALQRTLALVFAGGGLAVVLGVGLIGWLAARRLSARIDRVNAAFRSGDDAALAGLSTKARGDEIDELTGHSAAALGRMGRLVQSHRDTTDQVAHEIRTPLMHMDSKLLKALGEQSHDNVYGFIGAAREDLRRLVQMLESLLDIASSKARQGDSHGLRPVDLSDLVTRVAELYADSAEESGHNFICEVEPGIMIDGEEMQLMRLVTNLLDNAFKYVPSGGRVALTLKAGPELCVSDDGPGVPPESRAAIFERFNRGDGSNGDEQGAGLGLALARAIAERHGLVIELQDSDKGAKFVVSGGQS